MVILVEEPCGEVSTSEADGNECTPTLDMVTVEAMGTTMTEEATVAVEIGKAEGTKAAEFKEETGVDVADTGAADVETMED